MSKKVYVSIPTVRDGIKLGTHMSLLRSAIDAIKAGWDFLAESPPAGMTPIMAARNLALVQFLQTDASHMFLIDDDVVWDEGSFLRVLEAPVDVVGGVYPHRVDAIGFPVQWDADKILYADRETGLLQVKGLPAGFLRITRTVAERLIDAHSDRWYHESCSPTGRAYDIFDFQFLDHMKVSEDFIFCKKWREIGGKVWLDPSITFMHIGNKGFVGNLADWLKNRAPETVVIAPAIADRAGKIQHFYRSVPGWFEAEALYSAAVAIAPEGAYFVEVGAWKGRSASYMAVEIANSGKLIAFDVVDHFRGSAEVGHQTDHDVQNGTLRAAFERYTAPVKDYISGIIEDDSVAAAGRFKDGSLDFIFIDAGHDQESVEKDVLAWLPKLKPTGVIAGDDINWPGVRAAVDTLFGNLWVGYSGRCWIGGASLGAPPERYVGAIAAYLEGLGHGIAGTAEPVRQADQRAGHDDARPVRNARRAAPPEVPARAKGAAKADAGAVPASGRGGRSGNGHQKGGRLRAPEKGRRVRRVLPSRPPVAH